MNPSNCDCSKVTFSNIIYEKPSEEKCNLLIIVESNFIIYRLSILTIVLFSQFSKINLYSNNLNSLVIILGYKLLQLFIIYASNNFDKIKYN